jgi:hypothetical protein
LSLPSSTAREGSSRENDPATNGARHALKDTDLLDLEPAGLELCQPRCPLAPQERVIEDKAEPRRLVRDGAVAPIDGVVACKQTLALRASIMLYTM